MLSTLMISSWLIFFYNMPCKHAIQGVAFLKSVSICSRLPVEGPELDLLAFSVLYW